MRNITIWDRCLEERYRDDQSENKQRQAVILVEVVKITANTYCQAYQIGNVYFGVTFFNKGMPRKVFTESTVYIAHNEAGQHEKDIYRKP